ncbi:hypothetical protein [Paenibacillus marinisediminis]
MIPGMLSTIIVICIGILILSGWCGILFRGYSPYTILTVLLVWALCAGRQFTIGQVQLDMAWALWVVAAAIGLVVCIYHQHDISLSALLLGHLFLLGSIWCFVEFWEVAGYTRLPNIPSWLIAIGLGLICGMLYANVLRQWIIITLSLAIGEGIVQSRTLEDSIITLGSLNTFDAWWVAFATARVFVIFVVYVLQMPRAKIDNS